MNARDQLREQQKKRDELMRQPMIGMAGEMRGMATLASRLDRIMTKALASSDEDVNSEAEAILLEMSREDREKLETLQMIVSNMRNSLSEMRRTLDLLVEAVLEDKPDSEPETGSWPESNTEDMKSRTDLKKETKKAYEDRVHRTGREI